MSRRARGSGSEGELPPFPPHAFAMTWRAGAFLHWPVEPGVLRPRVPEPLELDTREGTAWISVLPFVLADAGLRGSPGWSRTTIRELNVRTYVRYRGDPGLFFFSIDVDSPAIALAAGRLTRLPCHRAMMRADGGGRITFGSSRPGSSPPARFAASYRPTEPASHAEPGSLAHWLVERRRFYAPTGRGVLTAEIGHAPWPLREATVEVRENTMFAANDLPDPDGEPVAHYCGELEMTGSLPRPV